MPPCGLTYSFYCTQRFVASYVQPQGASRLPSCCLYGMQAGRIGGVGLDTHWVEPAPRDDPIYSHPRVLALPHLGSISAEVYDRCARRLISSFRCLV